jgi:hypothetical protein
VDGKPMEMFTDPQSDTLTAVATGPLYSGVQDSDLKSARPQPGSPASGFYRTKPDMYSAVNPT